MTVMPQGAKTEGTTMRLSEAIRLGVELTCDRPEQQTKTLETIACLVDKATAALDASSDLTPGGHRDIPYSHVRVPLSRR